MASSASIPIFLCGKIPTHIQAVTEIVKPEFKIIKVCTSLDEARPLITALVAPSAGETVTIDDEAYPKPKVIVMGGGFADADFRSVYDTVDGAQSIPWIRPSTVKPGNVTPAAPPPAEEIASRTRVVLDAHMEAIKNSAAGGEIWWM